MDYIRLAKLSPINGIELSHKEAQYLTFLQSNHGKNNISIQKPPNAFFHNWQTLNNKFQVADRYLGENNTLQNYIVSSSQNIVSVGSQTLDNQNLSLTEFLKRNNSGELQTPQPKLNNPGELQTGNPKLNNSAELQTGKPKLNNSAELQTGNPKLNNPGELQTGKPKLNNPGELQTKETNYTSINEKEKRTSLNIRNSITKFTISLAKKISNGRCKDVALGTVKEKIKEIQVSDGLVISQASNSTSNSQYLDDSSDTYKNSRINNSCEMTSKSSDSGISSSLTTSASLTGVNLLQYNRNAEITVRDAKTGFKTLLVKSGDKSDVKSNIGTKRSRIKNTISKIFKLSDKSLSKPNIQSKTKLANPNIQSKTKLANPNIQSKTKPANPNIQNKTKPANPTPNSRNDSRKCIDICEQSKPQETLNEKYVLPDIKDKLPKVCFYIGSDCSSSSGSDCDGEMLEGKETPPKLSNKASYSSSGSSDLQRRYAIRRLFKKAGAKQHSPVLKSDYSISKFKKPTLENFSCAEKKSIMKYDAPWIKYYKNGKPAGIYKSDDYYYCLQMQIAMIVSHQHADYTSGELTDDTPSVEFGRSSLL
ncbi:hypothetical protein BB561_002985 [Smittium simulii]|uniref:Uncharacterized protein n=1 Tax=Smittium simulii TaxID=133385 RepID=A0A2T9YNE1_9FUNG|nr:hypothetical protein BB561_002985 [Smittium simulii]